MHRRVDVQIRHREQRRAGLRLDGQDAQVHRERNRSRRRQNGAARRIGHSERRCGTGRLDRRKGPVHLHLLDQDQPCRPRSRVPGHGDPAGDHHRLGEGAERHPQGGRHAHRRRGRQRHVHPQQEHLHGFGDLDQGRRPRGHLEHQPDVGPERRDPGHGGRTEQRPRLEPQRHSRNPDPRFELHRHLGRGEGLQQPADHPRRRRNQHGGAVRPRHVRDRTHRRPEGRASLDRLRRPGGQRRNRHRTPAGDRQQTPPELQLRARTEHPGPEFDEPLQRGAETGTGTPGRTLRIGQRRDGQGLRLQIAERPPGRQHRLDTRPAPRTVQPHPLALAERPRPEDRLPRIAALQRQVRRHEGRQPPQLHAQLFDRLPHA